MSNAVLAAHETRTIARPNREQHEMVVADASMLMAEKTRTAGYAMPRESGVGFAERLRNGHRRAM